MVDVSTVNTTALRTGTSWTIDVTATNLDPDLSVKDFIVLHANTLVPNTSYAKTSRVTLTYSGTALASNTLVEIRRKTPVDTIATVTYGNRFSSALWNSELERKSRWQAETDVNGSGLSGIGLPLPKNDVYSNLWGADIVFPPTRQAIYNKIETMPTLALASFTSNPTVPNIGSIVSNTQVPNTKYVSDFYAPISSPTLTGTPTAPTRTDGDSSLGLATTAFVQNNISRNIARYSASIASRASAVLATTNVICTLNATLTRANPVSVKVLGRPGITVAAVPWGIGFILQINGNTVSESLQYSNSYLNAGDICLEGHLGFLPLAAATSHTVTIIARVNPGGSSVAWNAFTFFVEFTY